METPKRLIQFGHNSRLCSFNDLQKVWHPSWFQGNRKRSGYFEGWYFKSSTADGSQTLACIPGISLAPGQEHAFVQVIDGRTGKTWYFRFPVSAFYFSDHAFEVRVGDNTFSNQGMNLSLDSDQGSFHGKLTFSELTPYKTSLFRPGIMGWYRFVPFMECYHGLVSMNHGVHGTLTTHEQEIHFDHGKGYIEKDWGTSMPEAWIWMQTNHFDYPGTSFMLSVAKIPWIGYSFTGFLGFFLHQGKRYDFATYTGAKILRIAHAPDSVQLNLTAGNIHIALQAEKKAAGALKAPVAGQMQRIIHESVDGILHLEVHTSKGEVIFQGAGKNAGIEIVGNQQLLTTH